VISDIVAFAPVPQYIRNDRELLRRCIGGAMEFSQFARLVTDAGLHGFGVVNAKGYARIDGLDFMSVTVVAHRVAAGARSATVTLTGPMSRAVTTFGEFLRGVPQTVGATAAAALRLPVYAPYFDFGESAETRSILPEATTCKYTGNFAALTAAFSEIEDDDGHVLRLGEPLEVCDKTTAVLSRRGYSELVTIQNRAAGRGVDALDVLCGDDCCC
jgi:hypothetical protein